MTPKKHQHNSWDIDLSFYLRFIVTCELCHSAKATDKAHRLKRDLIGWRDEDDRLEYFCAARLCRSCHRSLDEATGEEVHRTMFKIITMLILRRDTRPLLLTMGADLLKEFMDYVARSEWDPVRIYGKKEKQLTGESIPNRGLKPMIKTFCDDCGKEIHGKPLAEHTFRDSVTAKVVPVTVEINLKAQKKDVALCQDCAGEVYRHWLKMTAKEIK